MACIQVLLGHLQEHLELSLPEWIKAPIGIFHGVPIFFILSGYLIFISLLKSSDWKQYFDKRILRLYPELWICVLASLLSIAIFYDANVPFLDYIKFGFTQGTVFQFWTPDSLRGYGCGVPNGSLWTITVIVQFYIVIWLFFKYIKNASLKTWLVLVIASIAWSAFILPKIEEYLPITINKLIGCSILKHLWLFLIGTFIARFKNQLLDWIKQYWWACLIALLVCKYLHLDFGIGHYPVLQSIFLAFFIIGVAYKYPKLNVKTDISYGIYIWHMVFVNIIISLGYTQNWIAFGLCIIITFIAAYLSYLTAGIFYRKKKQQINS